MPGERRVGEPAGRCGHCARSAAAQPAPRFPSEGRNRFYYYFSLGKKKKFDFLEKKYRTFSMNCPVRKSRAFAAKQRTAARGRGRNRGERWGFGGALGMCSGEVGGTRGRSGPRRVSSGVCCGDNPAAGGGLSLPGWGHPRLRAAGLGGGSLAPGEWGGLGHPRN